jgi:hypothetical protein
MPIYVYLANRHAAVAASFSLEEDSHACVYVLCEYLSFFGMLTTGILIYSV